MLKNEVIWVRVKFCDEFEKISRKVYNAKLKECINMNFIKN